MFRITISKNEAVKLGLTRYRTGLPCKYGHIDERLTSNSTCVVCNRAISKKSAKKYRKTSKKFKEYIKRYRSQEAMIKKEKESSAKWKEKNKTHVAEYRKKYYEKNKEKLRMNKKQYIRNNAELYRKYAQERRCRLLGAGGSYSLKDISEMMERQGYKCVYCEKEIKNNYSIDHIIPLSKGGSNYKQNIQLTCRSCNSRKKDKCPEKFAEEIRLLFCKST